MNTLREVALALVVILGSRAPSVIHHFVVVPDRDPWVRGVGGLQVRIGAVETVTHTVILKHENLMPGLHHAAELVLSDFVGVVAHGVFIDVIAQVQYNVDVGFGDITVSMEKALRVIRTRRHRHFELSYLPHR